MEYYTYAYLREDGTPYYIGKGKNNRLYKKRKGEVNLPKDKSRIIFLKQNLTEEEAFKHEIYMISVFGRKDLGTGILHNRTDGGDGGSGIIFSEETRKKISERQSYSGNSFYGKTHSKETIEQMSKIKIGKIHSQETKDKISKSNKGKCITEETKEKLRTANLGKIVPQEVRNKISNSLKGENHYMFGKSLSQEIKDKISKSLSGENNIKSNLWKITFSDGKVIERYGLPKWAKDNGYSISCIWGIYKGIRKKHKDIVAVEKICYN
jgi:hypothetical protein